MKSRPFHLLLFLPLLLAGGFAYGQGPLEAGPKKTRTPGDYKVRTLKQIAAAGSHLVRAASYGTGGVREREVLRLVHGDLLPSRVRVTYKGPTRPLARSKKDIISEWAQKFAGNPEYYTVPYTNEVLFREGRVDHWVVVKAASLPEFKRRLKRGSVVDLYLIRLGGFKTRGKWTWVLLVDSFATPK
jgi:hypothetical protein